MKTKEQIEEMARVAFRKDTCSEWLKWQDETTVQGLELLSIDIAKTIYKDLLESASEGVGKFTEQCRSLMGHVLSKNEERLIKEAWQAARLSLMKEKSVEGV